MTPQARLQLIREYLKRRTYFAAYPASGQYRASHGGTPPKHRKPGITGPIGQGKQRYGVFGPLLGPVYRRKKWVSEPDKPRPVHCEPKRGKRVSPLTLISRQLPMKLPVIR